MDVLMEETLVKVFQSSDDKIAKVMKRTIQKLEDKIRDVPNQLDKCLKQHGLSGVVIDASLFSFANKHQAIMRAAKYLPSKASGELNQLKKFDLDIIQNRNMLAHAIEETTGDGRIVLRSKMHGKDGEEITEEWMSNFRRNIQEHRTAIDKICKALIEQFGSRNRQAILSNATPNCSASKGELRLRPV